MKKFSLLLLLFATRVLAFSQDTITDAIRKDVEIILAKIETENDDARLLNLVQDMYKSRVESYPLLIIELAQKLEKIAQVKKSPLLESSAWSYYGQGYRLSGNYTKGLECHHKAVSIAESTGNKSLLSIAQNQTAHIYKDKEEYEKALSLYRAALKNANEGENKESPLWPKMNLGAIFLALNELDSSLIYSQQAYDKCFEINTPRYLPYILLNIAGVYSKKGDNDQASKYFNMALSAAATSQSARYTNLVYLGLAENYLRNNQKDSCEYYAKQAIANVQGTVFTFLNIKPAKLLTDLYENTNADSTLKYLRIYRAANDSLFNARANQQLQMMTFDEDRRQQELATEKINYNNKIKMNMLLGGLGTFLLIALILFRNNKQKQKANTLLHRQKKEIEHTLSQLKTTQAQLVQSEKMASLGELTAGIAHEIQNPLNFVNNFSEVNKELLMEMKEEIEKGNLDDVKAIANDVIANEEKINHHGKRADAIVKGMLQHSRSGNGVKEPTDINALVDEYLRLAYHGLRAKDKSFNATFSMDLDPNLGKVNVIPQDIGRVLLNLITNAFHAVSTTTSKNSDQPYEPKVIVKTELLKPPLGGWGVNPLGGQGANTVQISITDNGPGIPDAIKEKIFQPFFTTKPTGQGTGLGLSLSYDIVKAHGGSIDVQSVPGEFTQFVITLPIE